MTHPQFDPNQMILYRPMNIISPSVTGLLSFGNPLTVNVGTWTNNPTSYAIQWNANGVPLVGQTGGSLTTTLGNLGQAITVSVSASNSIGSNAPELSSAVTII